MRLYSEGDWQGLFYQTHTDMGLCTYRGATSSRLSRTALATISSSTTRGLSGGEGEGDENMGGVSAQWGLLTLITGNCKI